MALNVYEEIDEQKPSLARRLTSNTEVAGTVMAYLNLLIGLSLRQGIPIEEVAIEGGHIEPLVGSDSFGRSWRGVFKANVRRKKVLITLQSSVFGQTDFVSYARAKAGHLAAALSKNPGLEKFFENMVDSLDQWGQKKGIPFEYLSVVDPIITKNDYVLTFKVGRRRDVV